MTAESLATWLDAYGRAWVDRDPDQVVGLFTDNASYRETTWEPAAVGHDEIRQYWIDAVGPQEDISFGYEIVTPQPAVVRWWATYTRVPAGTQAELDGVFLLDFADDGRCSELREWWFWREAPDVRS